MGDAGSDAPPLAAAVRALEDSPEDMARVALALGALRLRLGSALGRFRAYGPGAAFVGEEVGRLRVLESQCLRRLPPDVVAEIRARWAAIEAVLSPPRPPPGVVRPGLRR